MYSESFFYDQFLMQKITHYTQVNFFLMRLKIILVTGCTIHRYFSGWVKIHAKKFGDRSIYEVDLWTSIHSILI